MSAFKPEALVDKISKLIATQQSIETVSQWCIFFRKDAKRVVATWEAEFVRTKDLGKRLSLVYLANDILQNSRKKGPQFVNEFYHKLPPAVHQLLKYGDHKTRDSMSRMIRVWEERRVFGSSGLKPFTDLIHEKPKQDAATPSGRKGQILLQGADVTLERLEAAFADTSTSQVRCKSLADQCSAALAQDVTSSSPEEVQAGLKVLQQYAVALQNELGHRERTLAFLQQLIAPQEKGRQAAEEKLNVCQMRITQYKEHLQGAALNTVPSPPQDNGQHAEDEPMAKEQPSIPAVDGNLALLQEQAANAGFGLGSPGGFSAADLVAQLSQSGTSAQMLLDALAALPKEKEEQQPAQEEYDPELGM